jgi:precorrin-6B C5,15-methyltransferase / cobalt-precorrin-6B C5,C15-methyltransferase
MTEPSSGSTPSRSEVVATHTAPVVATRRAAAPWPPTSSIDAVCARLGWPRAEIDVLEADGAVTGIRRFLSPGNRIVVVSTDAAIPCRLAALLVSAGWGPSVLSVVGRAGTSRGHRVDRTAQSCLTGEVEAEGPVAVRCWPGPTATSVGRTPGLPDDGYRHDGQLTKREVRAVTLAHLAPRPVELLWDVGGGAGSIGIEWMRAHPSCRAIAVEADPGRAAAIGANSAVLGVPDLRVVVGRAPAALNGLPRPDAIFIGGGLTQEGMVETCWQALSDGGRLVANAVTLEGEGLLAAEHTRRGGSLVRLAVARAAPVGNFSGWQPARPVTIWSVLR